MTHGASRDFWTVIVFYRGGNWLAWTYELRKLARARLIAELIHEGATGQIIPVEVRHG